MSRRGKVLLFAAPSLVVLSLPASLVILWVGLGIFHGHTGSEPIGWYRTTSASPVRGDFVTFRLPDNLRVEGIRRGYIGSRWPLSPQFLTKRLAALPGDTVEVTRLGVFINGHPWPDSAPHEHDQRGRPMAVHYGSYRVKPGYFVALSDSPDGWGARYFGQLPATLIIGRAQRIWRWMDESNTKETHMKIAVETKAEPLKQLNLRVPASLRDQVEATRKLADQCGVDYNATVVKALAKFNADLHAQLSNSRSKTASESPSRIATHSNGSSDASA
jgi:conjugative transfer signal peptidase TraF